MGNFVEVQLDEHITGDFLMTNTAEGTVKMVDEEEEEHHRPQVGGKGQRARLSTPPQRLHSGADKYKGTPQTSCTCPPARPHTSSRWVAVRLITSPSPRQIPDTHMQTRAGELHVLRVF